MDVRLLFWGLQFQGRWEHSSNGHSPYLGVINSKEERHLAVLSPVDKSCMEATSHAESWQWLLSRSSKAKPPTANQTDPRGGFIPAEVVLSWRYDVQRGKSITSQINGMFT